MLLNLETTVPDRTNFLGFGDRENVPPAVLFRHHLASPSVIFLVVPQVRRLMFPGIISISFRRRDASVSGESGGQHSFSAFRFFECASLEEGGKRSVGHVETTDEGAVILDRERGRRTRTKEVEVARYKRVVARRLVCFNTLTGSLGRSVASSISPRTDYRSIVFPVEQHVPQEPGTQVQQERQRKISDR